MGWMAPTSVGNMGQMGMAPTSVGDMGGIAPTSVGDMGPSQLNIIIISEIFATQRPLVSSPIMAH